MVKSRVKGFLTGVTVIALCVIAAVDTILGFLETPIYWIIIIDLIIALVIAFAYFDERILKLEKNYENLRNKMNRLGKKGVTQLVAALIFMLLILLLIAVLTGVPNVASRLIQMNVTGSP